MIYKFCPNCKNPLKQAKIDEHRRIHCSACGFIYYNNPRPATGALIIDGNKILLGKRAKEPFKGWWDIPGGFMEIGELPEQTAKREVMEELGVTVKILDFIGAIADFYGSGEDRFPTLNFFYTTKITKGRPKTTDEITDYKWFDKKKLPKNIAFKNGRWAIATWLKRK